MKNVTLALSLMLAACGGTTDLTVCDLASQRIATCLDQPGADVGAVCQGQDATLAEQLLAADCAQIQAVMTAGARVKADSTGYAVDDRCYAMNAADTCVAYCTDYFSSPWLQFTSLALVKCIPMEEGGLQCQCQNQLSKLWNDLIGANDSPSEEPAAEEPAEEYPDNDLPEE